MDTIKRDARTAGLPYLLLVLVAPIRLVYLPSRLFVDGGMAVCLFWRGIRGRRAMHGPARAAGAVA